MNVATHQREKVGKMAKENKSNPITEYIQKTAKKKGISPAEWMQAAIQNASSYLRATHVGKFTDPSIFYQCSFYDTSNPVGDGYLSTADTEKIEDTVMPSAQYITLISFLNKRFIPDKDGEKVTVLELFRQDALYLKEGLSSLQIDYEETKADIFSVISSEAPAPELTSRFLRQVYFPLGDGTYHLLSILASSSLMCRVKEEAEKDRRESRDSGGTYRVIPDRVKLSYGDNQPQIISAQNAAEQYFYALLSVPPTLDEHYVEIPKGESFFDSLRVKGIYKDISRMQRLFLFGQRKGNGMRRMDFRKYRDTRFASIFDKILLQASALKSKEPGWSEETSLNQENRIWLDRKYADEKGSGKKWLKEIAKEFTRWFFCRYERSAEFHHYPSSIALGNGEWQEIVQMAETAFAEV